LRTQGPGKINYYDLAIGELVEPGLSRGIKANEIKDIGQVAGAEEIHLGDIVMKRGRRVIATDARFYVQYRGFNCDFEDQVAIIGHPNPVKPFSLQGDSGSVVVSAKRDLNSNAHKLKALLFAGGENNETGFDETFAGPVKRILRDFNLKI
jgi:putative intracellular protease/amidase